MHTVELKCTVPVCSASSAFFSNPSHVRDYFAHDGACQVVNNWCETVVVEGQKVVNYTVVLKFEDQMVANSVKQKYNNKIIQGTCVYADWYNTGETKKKNKKKTTAVDPEEPFDIIDDEEEETSYATILSFPRDIVNEPVDNKPSTQLLHHPKSTRVSPKPTSGHYSKSSSRKDSDSASHSPTPQLSSYRRHGQSKSYGHQFRSPSWSPTRHSTSSQESSPIRDRKERYLDANVSLNNDQHNSTRSSTSVADRKKYTLRSIQSRRDKRSRDRSPPSTRRREHKRHYSKERTSRSRSEEKDVERDKDYKLQKEEKVKEEHKKKETPEKPMDLVENVVDTHQALNIFDLLMPSVDQQLKSGTESDLSDCSESETVDFATCRNHIMKDFIESAKIQTSNSKILASHDPSIANHLRYSLHGNLMKLAHMYLNGVQLEIQSRKRKRNS